MAQMLRKIRKPFARTKPIAAKNSSSAGSHRLPRTACVPSERSANPTAASSVRLKINREIPGSLP